MIKDYFENELRVGDTVLFNSTIHTKFVIGRIESINESHSTVDIEYDGWCIERSCNDVIKFNGHIDHDGDSDVILPHTIGDITFYSKDELIEWVEAQQNFNKNINNFITYKLTNFLLEWIEEHMGTKAEAIEAIKISLIFNIKGININENFIDIDKSLNRLRELKHGLIFEIGYPRQTDYTIEEIENAIMMYHDIKNIIQRYPPEVAKKMLINKRDSLIQHKEEISPYIEYRIGYFLNKDIKILNYVLDEEI